MDTVLEVIRASISSSRVPAEALNHLAPPPQTIQDERLFLEDDDQNWGYHEEQVFFDNGEGTGVEGDLEAEDD